jgi:hypothetical protein
MAHMFAVGQAVTLVRRVLRTAAEGDYQIVRLMPDQPGGPQYRIKSVQEKHERMVSEDDLTLSTAPVSVFR